MEPGSGDQGVLLAQVHCRDEFTRSATDSLDVSPPSFEAGAVEEFACEVPGTGDERHHGRTLSRSAGTAEDL